MKNVHKKTVRPRSGAIRILIMVMVLALTVSPIITDMSGYATDTGTASPAQTLKSGEKSPDTPYKVKSSTTKVVNKGKSTFNASNLLPGKYNKNKFVLQGNTTDGAYNYYIFQRAGTRKSIIVKTSAKTNKRVKVSKYLVLDHANDVAYCSRDGMLYVVHNKIHTTRVTKVNSKTLKSAGYKDIPLDPKTEDLPKRWIKAFRGYASIGYNAKRDQFVLRLAKSSNMLIMDRNLKPVKFLYATNWTPKVRNTQAMWVDDNKIYLCKDLGGRYDVVDIYDWDGMYQYTVRVKSPYEIEGIFCVGGKYYANFYRSYWSRGKFCRRTYTYTFTV